MEPTLEQQVQYLSSQVVDLTSNLNALAAGFRTRMDELEARIPAPRAPRQAPGATQGATTRQIRYLWAVSRELGMSVAEVEELCSETFSCAVDELTRRNASAFIEQLQANRPLHRLADNDVRV